MAINDVYDLLKEKNELCVKDIRLFFDISTQHADRLFNNLAKYQEIEVFKRIIKINNREFLIKYLRIKH